MFAFLTRIKSALAWRRMQSHFAKLESSQATRIKGQARKDRAATVLAALEAGRAG